MAQISIVVPMLNERENVPALYERLCQLGKLLSSHELEIVFVDDGSTDGSADLVKELLARDERIQLIRLSRSFGSHAAIAAGFRHSSGDVATVLSADIQDPPELIPLMVGKWQEGHEIVWGVRTGRGDPLMARLSSSIYHRLMRKYALPQMPTGGVDVCLVDRRVITALANLQESNTSIFGLIMWSGFSQAFVHYRRQERKLGASKWTLGKKVKLFVDSFVSFSLAPIRIISLFGASVAIVGFLYGGFLIATALWQAQPLHRWAMFMAFFLVMSGVQLLVLGVIGAYLWRTLDAARQRPLYIVREICSSHTV